MKTIKRQIEEIFSEPIIGHPSRRNDLDIEKIKRAILLLAQAVDVDRFNNGF